MIVNSEPWAALWRGRGMRRYRLVAMVRVYNAIRYLIYKANLPVHDIVVLSSFFLQAPFVIRAVGLASTAELELLQTFRNPSNLCSNDNRVLCYCC